MKKFFLYYLIGFISCNYVLADVSKPNIVLIFIDDMGWGDFSCFGNTEASTPQIDALAQEGIRFEQFYVNSPICSPSRVAISTGQYPQRWRISSYLAKRTLNNDRGMAQWLDPEAPMLARFLQQAGYATGHFGKWHMGGQRDVDNAPPIKAYGFDESLTNFEGMGPKLLPLTEEPTANGGIKEGRIWADAERLGGPVQWTLRSQITGGFVERAISFIDKSQDQGKPFYINVWPDDVHTPMYPSIENWANTKPGRYRSVLEEMDQQFAALFDRIAEDPDLRNNTLVLICSDNGPEENCGSAGVFKGLKATLYEGGIRSPLVVWGPGFMDPNQLGTVNQDSVFCAMDLVPSLLEFTEVAAPDTVDFDGESVLDTLLGNSTASRSEPIFFRRPPDRKNYRSFTSLPDLAVRDGRWKLMCDYDGSRVVLYDLLTDPSESRTLIRQGRGQPPAEADYLLQAVLNWNKQLPQDAGNPSSK